jgi:hypothetical protein
MDLHDKWNELLISVVCGLKYTFNYVGTFRVKRTTKPLGVWLVVMQKRDVHVPQLYATTASLIGQDFPVSTG